VRLALAAVVVLGCSGGGTEPDGPNHVTGVVQGNRFNGVAAAYWIGKPSAGSPPVIVFLLEDYLDCATISQFNWDKTIGNSQVLEMSAPQLDARTFTVRSEATVAYLRGEYNPDAGSGQLTISTVTPMVNLVGTFSATFTGSDVLDGAFDAQYCASGVEP